MTPNKADDFSGNVSLEVVDSESASHAQGLQNSQSGIPVRRSRVGVGRLIYMTSYRLARLPGTSGRRSSGPRPPKEPGRMATMGSNNGTGILRFLLSG